MKKMICGIYKFENKINHHCYIGQSINIEQRYKDHLSRAKNNSKQEKSSLLHKAIQKYGIKNFSFEILEECSKEKLNEREKYWIKKYNSHQDGYNQTDGGEQLADICYKINEELSLIIKQELLNNKLTYDELHQKYNISTGRISEINTGKIWYDNSLDYPLRKTGKTSTIWICPICGGKKDKEAKICSSCYKKTLHKYPISRNELKKLIRTIPFTQIGKQYNVTDNSIRKWCKGYNLPYRKNDINKISDKDWELI